MTAISNQVWKFTQAGTPLSAGSLPIPELAADELLIQNHASGINPVDWKFIADNPLNWPEDQVPGIDGAGIVIKAGSDVDASRVGCIPLLITRLCLITAVMGKYTIVKASRVLRLPATIDTALGAALPCPMLTA